MQAVDRRVAVAHVGDGADDEDERQVREAEDLAADDDRSQKRVRRAAEDGHAAQSRGRLHRQADQGTGERSQRRTCDEQRHHLAAEESSRQREDREQRLQREIPGERLSRERFADQLRRNARIAPFPAQQRQHAQSRTDEKRAPERTGDQLREAVLDMVHRPGEQASGDAEDEAERDQASACGEGRRERGGQIERELSQPQRARSAACISNLKQLGTATGMYLSDNNDWLMPQLTFLQAGSGNYYQEGWTALLVDYIDKKGYQPILYSSKYNLENYWYETDYKTWLAHYTDQTNYVGNYYIWQLTANGKVDGIDKNVVDIDILYK